jgi:hypothetical protein
MRGIIMLPSKALEAASISITNDLSEYLGELDTLNIIHNMEKMDYDELVEFKKSIEIISKVIQLDIIN